jgi:ATP-dependent DNA helicase RecQ
LAHLQGQAPTARCTTCDNCRRIALRTAQAKEAEAPPLHAARTTPRFQPEATVQVRRYGVGQVIAADALAVDIESLPMEASAPSIRTL